MAGAVALVAFAAPLAAADGTTFTLSPNINNWWIEVAVTGSPTAVSASIDGGSPIALTHEWWGHWGVSTHVPAGSTVVFTATVNGGTVTSQAYKWPDVPREARALPTSVIGTTLVGGSGVSSANSNSATSSFTQTVDIPPDNVLAALALGHSGLFGIGGIGQIANIQQSSSVSQASNNAFSIDPQSALILAALGNNFGSLSSLSAGVSGSAYLQCIEQERIARGLGLATNVLC